MAAHQAPPSLGFSRQEHWSGLPFPSPMHESEKWKRSRSVGSDSSRPHGLQPTRLLLPWGFPGKSTGVGCIAFSPKASRASQSESQLPPRLPFSGAGRRCGLHLFACLAPPRGHVSPPSGAKVQRFVLGASSSSACLADLPGRTLSYCHFPEERRLPRWPWW